MPPFVRGIHAPGSWAMQKHPSGRRMSDRLAAADAADVRVTGSPVRRSPVHWLIVCGGLLIAAILVGTAVMVGNFRERALSSSERELENTVLLLARHFAQQLEDFSIIQKDLVAQIQRTGISSPDVFRDHMSTAEMQEVLRAKV